MTGCRPTSTRTATCGSVRRGWPTSCARSSQSPNYRRGALFVVYDEWGGFFDHVRPPRVPDIRASNDPNEDWGQMGFRIPAVAVSPYSRKRGNARAQVDHQTYGFESILKLIEHRFALGNLTVRDRYAANIGRGFDWARPQFDAPDLPDPASVASRPCALGGDTSGLSKESFDEHASDLADLEELAYRFGVPVGDGKVDQIFTQPDKLRRAVRAGKVPRATR